MSTIPNLPSERVAKSLITNLVLGVRRCCPSCQSNLQQAPTYYWCRRCRIKVTAKSASWLKQSNLSYQQLWLLIACWQARYAVGAVRGLTGLSYPTIARWYDRFRNHLPKDTAVLCDQVAVDEACFGRRAHSGLTWVVGATEVDTGRRKLAVVGTRDESTLHQFVLDAVTTDSHLFTDGWGSYGALCDYGYGHTISVHEAGDFGLTAYIESVWSTAKRQVRRMYAKTVQRYLAGLLREWEARANFKQLFTSPLAYLEGVLVPS